MKFYALGYNDTLNLPHIEINATSRSEDWGKCLSPFLLGPVVSVNGAAKNVENMWQYSKVYEKDWDDELNQPKPWYWEWRQKGFDKREGVRYPYGKENRKYIVGTWIGKQGEIGQLIPYVRARKELYVPMYLQGLRNSKFYPTFIKFIADAYHTDTNLVFKDFDVFNHYEKSLTTDMILNNPNLKYGHGFILVDEAYRFINSHEEAFDSFEIKNYSSDESSQVSSS